MATLILTTVGTLVGGPISGAIGALIGQSVDARLFAPPGREGPRLSDLRVQTSSYGSDIPAIFGRMRVSGTVIWASELVEHRQRSGGKGQPTTTSYSYSVSMAVALSSRPLARIDRIWAEGNLLRGSAGDVKSPVTIRLHDGGEDQPVDPLIAAAVGINACPACRGIAYVVLEDFDLAPFGNRIPSLTFEVEAADEAAPFLTSPMLALIPDATIGDRGPAITGAALAGGTARDWIQAFAPLLTVDRAAGEWRINGNDDGVPIVLGEAASDRGAMQVQRRQSGASAVSAAVRIDVYEPSRDFQIARASAKVAGGTGADAQVALPLAMPVATARQLAVDGAYRKLAFGDSWTLAQGFSALAVAPGCAVQLADGAAALVVDERRIEGASVNLSLSRRRMLSSPALPADVGSHAASPDLLVGETVAALFDVPTTDGGGGGQLLLAASGTGAGWRRARVSLTASSGGLPEVIGDIASVAVLGRAIAGSMAPTALVIDRSGWIEVALAREDMALDNVDDAALLGGANLALLGDELIQFGRAQPLGGGRWRLSILLRGRLGSDAAMAAPLPGRPFTLARDAALLPVTARYVAATNGGTIIVESATANALTLPFTPIRVAQIPLSPVHPTVSYEGDGAIIIGWTRRSRMGFGWLDTLDAPIDQRDERYLVQVGTGGTAIERSVLAPQCRIEAAAILPWRAVGGVAVLIRQVGDNGESPPLSCQVALA